MVKFKLLLKDRLKKIIPQEKLDLLPSGYQRVGDIVLLHINQEFERQEKEIGEVTKEILGVKSVFSRRKVSGELRKPEVKRIAGRTNTTVHRENGCLFKIDVTKLMFSKGNVNERCMVSVGEEDIVDMFAGLGYFSIPIAKSNPLCKVYAIEKNPVAVKFLRENIRLNRVDNVEVIKGDCREVEDIQCDRIVMGYFPGTEAFLSKAFSLLRREGTIHFHNIYRGKELWRKPLGTLETQALENRYSLQKVLEKRIVKQYSPCKYHVVVDAKFRAL